jgi:hypothetical protein
MVRILSQNEATPGYVIIVDAAGNGDYESIQDALDYANTQSPNINRQWLVLVCPGVYVDALTLYDYIHIAGLSPDHSVILSPSAATLIESLAICTISNLKIVSATDPIITTDVGDTSKTLTLRNIFCEENDAGVDFLELAYGTVVLDRCNLRYGGAIDLLGGTLKVWDSMLNHYHTDGGAPTEHTIEVAATSTLEIIRSTVENTSPAGSAIKFSGAPTSCKLLHSIFKKSSAATYSLDTATAISITMARCLINAAIHGDITISGTNDTDTSI